MAGADRARRRRGEVWWFQRTAGTTTSAADDAPLDRCPGCGAPLAPTSDGGSAYCQHQLSDPFSWVLTRLSDAPPVPPAGFCAITIDSQLSPGRPGTSGWSSPCRPVFVIGGVGAGVVLASRATRQATKAFTSVTEETGPGFTLPPGVTLPAGVTLPGKAPAGPHHHWLRHARG